MDEKTQKIITSIEEKRNRLKEKAERYFAAISVPPSSQTETSSNQGSKTPPISYIAYGGAVVSLIGAFVSDTKWPLFLLTAGLAYAGYRLSGMNLSSSPQPSVPSLSNIKTDVTSKVIDAVKKTTAEWEEFITLQKKEIQNVIATSSLSADEKESATSKTYLYEVIDIRVLDLSNLINSATTTSELKNALEACKSKLLAAIDKAITQQLNIYNSLGV